MNRHFDVVVVGAGLAGLAAGATAAAGGASTVVLDAHQPGGRARTTVRDGFAFNHGVHAFFAGGPGMAVLRALNVGVTGAPPPIDRYMILADGQQHELPLGPDTLARTTYFDARDKAQFGVLVEHIGELDATRLQGTSVSDWLAAKDLRPRVDSLMRALFRLSTYAADLDNFAADAAIAHQQVAARAGVLYLDHGWGQLVQRLRDRAEVRSGVAVRSVAGDASAVTVETDAGTVLAGAVIVATGLPRAARSLLAASPPWDGLGAPITAACLDVGLRRVPSPGYVLGVDRPIYGTVQSPPAKQPRTGGVVAGLIRYGANNAVADRAELEAHLTEMGVGDEDVTSRRFLARMVVSGAMPTASAGGLAGRPSVRATGMPNVFIAGDWVGTDGVLADAALASGHEAARAALRAISGGTRTPMVMARR